jgi:energy-coupling factor transporter transmembrane protein EcfT
MRKTLLGYLPVDSPIHSLHPVTKVLLLLLLSAYPMMIDMPEANLIGLVFMLILLQYARVKLMVLSQYKTILLNLFFVIAIAYTFFGGYAPGYRILFQFGALRIAWDNLRWAISVYVKLVFAVLVIIFFLSTTRERDLLVGLRTLRVPYVISYVIGLSFRSIGVSLIDFLTIREAERARALDLSSLPYTQRIKKFGLYIVPMTALVLRRAEEVSNALDSRGFAFKGIRETKRTDYILSLYRIRARDCAVIIALAAIFVLIVILRYHYGMLTASSSYLYRL